MRACGLVLVVVSLVVGGCASHPFFAPRGNIYQQRLRATVHDPYSDQDAGPEVVGGRPRDYQQPLPEPVRSRVFADTFWGR